MKTRFFWNLRTRDDLYQALEFFSSSIDKGPALRAVICGLADTYLVLLDYRDIAPNEALAPAAAVNALRLDEQLPDAHTSLAHAKMHALHCDGAEHEFWRTIQLGPGYALAHFYYANVLAGRRRLEAAISLARAALKLDPVVSENSNNEKPGASRGFKREIRPGGPISTARGRPLTVYRPLQAIFQIPLYHYGAS